MTEFDYQDGEMCAERVRLGAIAESVGTPFYCYSTAALTRNYAAFRDAFQGRDATICYAMKANDNLAVLKTLGDLGAGADVVSGGELRRAIRAGVPAERIVFSGVGKTREELELALDEDILQINVESVPELDLLSEVAAGKGTAVEIAIRVNPDVDANTHDKIATGRREDKFGIDIEVAAEAYARAAELPGIEPVSVAVHIGSQLTELGPFRAAFGEVARLVERLRGEGHGIARLDLGGGLGISYRDETPPSPADYAAMADEVVGHLGCRLLIEPGRAIAGTAGVLVARVIYVKQGRARGHVILDAAMNDLIRPAMYQAWHDIRPVREPGPGAALAPVDVVGPVCETGDTFARGRELPPLEAGDLVVFDDAGAYGAVMASAYNARPLTPEVLVHGDSFAEVRARPSHDQMVNLESFAGWQETPARRGAA
ncbi:MAG: diaminopimelate decarboxylase [Alphaproteobacteria bacterium]|jgi:diaminopimelate decarboxylase|nr:diaminopimelate decarboxylase [Alphaproteobacteria bacterium]